MKPKITLSAVSNVFTRMMHFLTAGDEEISMKQTRDHMLLLSSGSIQVTVDTAETKFDAPHMILISAGKNYKLTALKDDTVAVSIHVIRDNTTGDIIDASMIPAGMLSDLSQFEPFTKE